METGKAEVEDSGSASRRTGATSVDSLSSGTGSAVSGAASRAVSPVSGRGESRYGSRGSLRLHMLRPEVWVTGAALLLVLGFVYPRAYTAPTLRAAVETIMTGCALAAAALLREQFLQTRRLRELLLLSVVIILALAEFLANALPAGLGVPSGTGFTAALPLAQLLIAGLLVVSARTPSARIALRPRRALLISITTSVAVFGAAELGGLLLRSQLLIGASSQMGIDRALRHPLGVAVLLVTAGLFAWAAAEFANRARAEDSPVLPILAAAALLLGAARLYYLALPWVSSDTLSLREVFRVVAVGIIFIAALRGHFELRAAGARAAAAAERRRVAQDLHDGLAQDLAFIAAHAAQMAAELGEEHPVARAARHALAVSRDTIRELSDLSSSSPREALEAVAAEQNLRFGITIVVDAAADGALAADSRDQVVRIAREAIANAARHGGAQHVLVSLKRSSLGTVLRVVDDGSGIRIGSGAAREGFGIQSMRDRAAALGGSLRVRAAGSKGTELEVFFP